jgi:hypothetical protein
MRGNWHSLSRFFRDTVLRGLNYPTMPKLLKELIRHFADNKPDYAELNFLTILQG